MAKDEEVKIISNSFPQESDKYERNFLIKRTTAKILLITVLISLLILIINFAAMIFLTVAATSMIKSAEVKEFRLQNISSTANMNFTVNNNKKLNLISRAEWIAQPPSEELTGLVLPVNTIIIAHTATEYCTTQAVCNLRMRFIQTYHMESRGWDDIGYNFLIGGDGRAYVGRGWDKVGAHTKRHNIGSICIAFIGDFSKYEPPNGQLEAAKLLIEEGVKLNKISQNYELYGHRQLTNTSSPGDILYNIIKAWPHWKNVVALQYNKDN